MNYDILQLNEQKYVGIKTFIKFSEHDCVDFLSLHEEVIHANIKHINEDEHFSAIDADFTTDGFSYTPLIPVNSFEGNDDFFHFTRKKGTYYSFDVKQIECNPAWFKRAFNYMKENSLRIENTGYDMEYYQKDYLRLLKNENLNFEEVIFSILFLSKSD